MLTTASVFLSLHPDNQHSMQYLCQSCMLIFVGVFLVEPLAVVDLQHCRCHGQSLAMSMQTSTSCHLNWHVAQNVQEL